MKQLQFPQLGISLGQYVNLAKNTRFTRNAKEKYLSGGQIPVAPRPNKRSRKQGRQIHNQSNLFHLQSSTFLSNKTSCSLRTIKLSSLPKHCVPNYMKTLEIFKDLIQIQTTKLDSNSRKKGGWIVQCLGNRTKLLNDSQKLIGLQQPAYFQLDFAMFCTIFEKELEENSEEQRMAVFNEFKLRQDQCIYWPVSIFQSLNFQNIKDIRKDIQNKKCRDDRVKLNFSSVNLKVEAISQNVSQFFPLSEAPSQMQFFEQSALPMIQELPNQNNQRNPQVIQQNRMEIQDVIIQNQLKNQQQVELKEVNPDQIQMIVEQNQFVIKQPEEQEKQKQKIQQNMQPVLENISVNVLKQEQISKNPTSFNRQIQNEQQNDHEVLIWFTGTNVYKFVKLNELIHVNEILPSQASRFFKETRLKPILEDFNELISAVNVSITKYDHYDLRSDEKKYFMHRLVKKRQQRSTDNLYLVLRIKQSKQSKQVLILSLKEATTSWQSPQSLIVCYLLPKFAKKQLKILLILPLLDPQIRQKFIISKLLDSFTNSNHQKSLLIQTFFEKKSNDVTVFEPRCKSCHYKISSKRERSIECYFCHSFYHSDCDDETRMLKFKGQNQYWCCSSCIPCEVCFLHIQKADLVECMTCKNHYHQKCGINKNTTAKFQCQDCLKCDLCLKKLSSSSEQCFFQGDNMYCQNCIKLLGRGDYCKMCKATQPKGEWTKCDLCTGWIHKVCDETLKNNYKHFTQANTEYYCPCCRDDRNRSYFIQLLNILMKFDEFGYFSPPVPETLLDYKDIIAKPMCFTQMIDQCKQGYYDTNSLQLIQKDVNLIISNAMEYNMPKQLCHYSARVLKLMSIQFFNFFGPFFELSPMSIISDKTINESIIQTQRKLFKHIYQHYLQIILNYGYTNSEITVKMKPVQPPEPFIFQSRQLLKLFRNCQISISFNKNEPLIDHLFSQPKIFEPLKLPITKPICYFHNQSNIMSTCDICLESFCCIKECFLHRICTHCNQKACRCDNWGCGCPPGINPKDLQHYSLREYKGDILAITRMYQYCPRCAIEKIQLWKCKYCYKLCSHGSHQCRHCSKYYHNQCASEQKSQSRILHDLCLECEMNPINNVRRKQALHVSVFNNLTRMKKVEKILPTALFIYYSQGINLQPTVIRELLFKNYDRIEEFDQDIECYDANIQDINNIKMVEENNQSDMKNIPKIIDNSPSLLTEVELFQITETVYRLTYKVNQINITCQQYEIESNIRSNSIQMLWVEIDKCVSIYQAYLFIKNISQEQHPEEAINHFEDKEQKSKGESSSQQVHKMIVEEPYYEKLDVKIHFYRNLVFDIRRVKQVCILEPQRRILCQKKVSHNQQALFKRSSSNHNTKKFLAIRAVVKGVFLDIYNQLKLYSRVGSTCLINHQKNHIQVYKKWSTRPGLWISLQKVGKQWKFKINDYVVTLKTFQQLLDQVRRITGGEYSNIRTIQEVARFLGFNIYESQPQKYTYTTFLQTHPLEGADRKTAVLKAYDSLKIPKIQRKQLFFMRKKKKPEVVDVQPQNRPPAHYFLFEQILRQLEDQPYTQKNQLRRTEPSKQIFIAPSTIHKLGLFSTKFQKKNTVLIEYMGQILSEPMADLRESLYHLGCYMFAIPKKIDESPKINDDVTYDSSTPHFSNSKRDVIDATYRGNQARYLNHSCDPNCASMIDERNGTPRILIYAIKDIQPYQELTYDYQFKVTAGQKIICTCKAKNCQGRLN